MVGVQDVKKVTPSQMTWLRRGGRNLIYRLLNEMAVKLQALGLLWDFSGRIWLPTDIIVYAEAEDGGGVFWTYDEDMMEEAREHAEEVKEMNPHVKVSIKRAGNSSKLKTTAY